MPKLNIATITKRSIRGFLALTLVQLISSVLIFVLAGIIDPQTFGVFIVVSASLSFLAYFSDIGLAAALVQKKEEVTEEDLKTTFTIQQALVITVIAISFFSTPLVAGFYKLDIPGIQLFWALLFSFFLSSLKTIPSILLERKLEFHKLSIPQIVEVLVFNIVAVLLALRGLGITSFTYAVLARGIAGVLVIYIISPWRIRIGFSKESSRKLLSFGLPFQVNSVLALIKDDFLIIFLGKVLSFTQVGYIGFAQKSAFFPLRLIMDKIIRVTFPAFSRLQEDTKNLKIAIEKTIFTLSFFIFPATAGLVILAPYAIHIIPKYNKWEAALPSIGFFAINALFSSISAPLTNFLNALGKIKITLKLMVFWTISTWVLTLVLIQFLGFLGVAVASAIIASSVVFVVYLVKRHINFAVVKSITKPFLSTIVMGVVLYFLAPILVKDVATLILAVIIGGAIYLGILYLIAQKEIKTSLQLTLRNLR